MTRSDPLLRAGSNHRSELANIPIERNQIEETLTIVQLEN